MTIFDIEVKIYEYSCMHKFSFPVTHVLISEENAQELIEEYKENTLTDKPFSRPLRFRGIPIYSTTELEKDKILVG